MTYAWGLVSGSVRSEFDETLDFGLLCPVIEQLLRIVDIVKTIPHEQRENTIYIGRKKKRKKKSEPRATRRDEKRDPAKRAIFENDRSKSIREVNARTHDIQCERQCRDGKSSKLKNINFRIALDIRRHRVRQKRNGDIHSI